MRERYCYITFTIILNNFKLLCHNLFMFIIKQTVQQRSTEKTKVILIAVKKRHYHLFLSVESYPFIVYSYYELYIPTTNFMDINHYSN